MKENNISDFWQIDQSKLNTKQILKYAREYYTDGFINNYPYWLDHVEELNKAIKGYMTVNMNMTEDSYEDMSFDWFCKTVIDMITEWITENGKITRADINVVTEQLVAEYVAKMMEILKSKIFTIPSILDSIRKLKAE
jgi:hypothetical protein